ncbi:hypothetical protein DOTSEDRAFT_69417 [Dothistroma septosporum NZE10]|uniref:Atos-like conserved domain-containing protein n=1 Tax=Dothistroma septosporum (strain NZE10 / CBS 128990) TaxID=675120 RepID=N1PZ03_DOTSN|nr:hypothetical protein DOTSEDRAFT_69417 [Dothistroma septosporum NZE10]
MAVNNGRHDGQRTHAQSGGSNGSEDGTALQRTRAASPEHGRSSPTIFNPYYTGRPRTPANSSRSAVIDRQEIIRRIKSNGSRPSSPELDKSCTTDRQELIRRVRGLEPRPISPELERPSSNEPSRKRKAPAPRSTTTTVSDSGPKSPETLHDNLSAGMQIERPRSALHRGDFRERQQSEAISFERTTRAGREEAVPGLATSPVAPWHPDFPGTALRSNRESHAVPPPISGGSPIHPRAVRDRAISNVSLATSFAYKPPTSPLVQSSWPDTPEQTKSPSPDRSRRHTFSPQSLKYFQTAIEYPASARVHGTPTPPHRSERTFPYQAHQPRRSFNTTSFSSLPQTRIPGVRRPSLTADSPLQHAPMVGSYEECILRGRMSTVPSRPLNFMAQIGVLGKGNCRSNLRCPPHVSVQFPAVFYSYGHVAKTPANDQPSPYVGLLDLENHLPSFEDTRDKRRERVLESRSNEGSRASSPRVTGEDGSASDAARQRRRQKAKRRSGSPKAPPGGSYRIPQQGQLQIVIKNPNKTAVKLFLVPFDLSDMEPGQKTFIRQRSYSAGPIIDMPLSSRNNLGTDRPEASLNPTGDPNDRPMLRYLIHLHICCPSKGRYFLYKSVRVVFANRVPDGKEKLRNEIQLPEPRYSPYKPGRDSIAAMTGGNNAKDDTSRRSDRNWSMAQSLPAHNYGSRSYQPPPLPPRHASALPTLDSRPRPSSQQYSDRMDVDSNSQDTPSVRLPTSSNGDTSQRINVPQLQDPFNFERDMSRERRSIVCNESLLSKRLMDLAFQKQAHTQDDAP